MNTRADDSLITPWRESAARLVQMLESATDPELCLAVLKQLTRRFGDHGFPGFLKLLLTVAESSNELARRKLAEAIALGLRRGDAPSGVLTSWGATRFWSDRQPLRAGLLPGNLFSAPPRRQLDPIEYLTVWFSQSTHRPYLSEGAYHECLVRLLALFNSSPLAREWYPLKIEADLAGIEGAFTRQTRQRLAILVETWKRGQPVAVVVAAAADAREIPT